jgi:hypothetical protein
VLFLFSLLIYLILFALNIKKFISQNICAMQNYIMLTQKILTFLYTYYFKSWTKYFYFLFTIWKGK